MKIKSATIIYWQNQPPKVELGTLNYLSKTANKTIYICYNDLPDERKKIGWNNVDYGKAQVIILNSKDELINYSNNYLNDENVINIVSGLSGGMAKIICPYFKRNRIRFFVISERPRILFCGFRNTIVSILVYIKHLLLRLIYQKYVIAIFACGKKGCDTFSKIGWKYDKIVHFMYCGEYIINKLPYKEIDKNNIRFLYIGRFGYNHALDIMIDSFNKLNKNNWSLYMAGGYGEKKDDVFRWIESKENVKFIGRVDASQVTNIMQKYDVLVVPSRLEGWNCQICEAISIGVPVLTFDESVSGELIHYSNGGISISSQSSNEFSNSIEIVLENPSIIEIWRENLQNYYVNISPNVVGAYFIEVLEAYINKKEVPRCPWEKEGEK